MVVRTLLLIWSASQSLLEEGFTRELSAILTAPMHPADLEISIRNQDDLERAKPLIKHSYDESG